MRTYVALFFAGLLIPASAQTVSTVQNGNWDAPSTWSCNCVPSGNSSLVIMHTVQLLGDLDMLFPQVQVTSTGEILTSFPVNVINDGTFIVEGHVFFQGSFINLQLVDITGFFEVAGDFHTDGSLILDGGVLQVEGDFTNLASVDGEGSICVYDVTTNEGSISGTVDVCDFTQTATSPPLMDNNTGSIAGTVTYCTNSACATGIDVPELMGITMSTGSQRVTISGLPPASRIVVLDPSGRACISRSAASERIDLDVSKLAPGAYRIVVSTSDSLRAFPFAIVR